MTFTRRTARRCAALSAAVLFFFGVGFVGAGVVSLAVPLQDTLVGERFEDFRATSLALLGVGWIAFSVLPLFFAAATGGGLRRDPALVSLVGGSLLPGRQVVAIPSFWGEAAARIGPRTHAVAGAAVGVVAVVATALPAAALTHLLDEAYTWEAMRAHFGASAIVGGVVAARFALAATSFLRRVDDLD